jgi:adenylosuccinate lyase
MPGLSKDLVCPIDYRYKADCHDMVEGCFSEAAHIKTCFDAEVFYWQRIVRILKGDQIDNIPYNRYGHHLESVKHYETIHKHDIKAIEYAVRDFISEGQGNENDIEYVHYGLTSQDIVSLSTNDRLKKAINTWIMPAILRVIVQLTKMAENSEKYLYCRTHGQRGNVTTFRKEFGKYAYRLTLEHRRLKDIEWSCKFSGSTGDFTTFKILHPQIDIEKEVSDFLKDTYDLKRSLCTTQTDYWKSLCECFNILRDMSNMLVDLCRDMWMYHMNGDIRPVYINKMQAGSSVMPQKINPIGFENAEGNLEMCEMWSTFLTSKLKKSRLQRDLTDSVVIRNIGIPVCNMLIALKTIERELGNIAFVSIDNLDYSVFGELIQTKLRSLGDKHAYETTKNKFRTGTTMNSTRFFKLCDELFGPGKYDDIKNYIYNIDNDSDD